MPKLGSNQDAFFVGECANKLWYIQTMKLYLVLKRNELLTLKTHRRTLKMHVSERNKSDKPSYCMIPTLQHFGNGKTMETVKKMIMGEWQCGEG